MFTCLDADGAEDEDEPDPEKGGNAALRYQTDAVDAQAVDHRHEEDIAVHEAPFVFGVGGDGGRN